MKEEEEDRRKRTVEISKKCLIKKGKKEMERRNLTVNRVCWKSKLED